MNRARISAYPTDDLEPLAREAHDWIARFLSGDATDADLESVQHWCAQSPAHAQAMTDASRMWDELGPAGRIFQGEKPPVRAAKHVKLVTRRHAILGGALAASAAGITALAIRPPFGLWPSLPSLTADYRTATGEQRQVTLADGLIVAMNTQTSIIRRPTADHSTQIELISGEAAIEAISAAGTLKVIAAAGRVVSADAAFNLRHDQDAVCVTCVKGTVRVEYGSTVVPLGPGQDIVYSSRGIGTQGNADPEVITAWQKGLLIFRETPVVQAIAEINRYRPGKVILTDRALGERLFSARFQIAHIDEVLGRIQRIFGAEVTELPGGIALLS
jgi:transmembrane sensor